MPLRKHLLVLFIIPFFFVVFGVGYRPFDLLNLCDFEDIKKAQLVAGHPLDNRRDDSLWLFPVVYDDSKHLKLVIARTHQLP